MKYVIDFYDHVTDEDILQYFSDNTITVIKQLESFGKVYLIQTDTEIVSTEIIENFILDTEQGIELLSFSIDLVDNYVETSFDIEDEKNWWKVATISSIDFDDQIHNHKIRGMNSTVYIIDSGINVDHSEFINSNITLLHSFNDNFTDTSGHGTGLSSIIVGPTCGLANPHLKVVKLFDTTQPTYQSDMVMALDAILNDYISNGRKPSVVNMSWAIPKNDYINSKIQYMIDQGLYVVAASGNNGTPITDVTPACIPDVLTVGSYGKNLTPSSFSNYTGGSDISYTNGDVNYGVLDGWAPGEMIWAANKDGSYGYIAGTSVAAAITSSSIAYNASNMINESGMIHDKYGAVDVQSLFRSTMMRTGLLDLSDERYINSVNKITTIISNGVNTPSFYTHTIETAVNTPRNVRIASPVNNTKISFTSSLPDYITITNDGFLTILYTDSVDTYITLPELHINITNKDGSESNVFVNFIVVNEADGTMKNLYDVNPDSIQDDFILSYVLSGDLYCLDDLANQTCVDINDSCVSQSREFQPYFCVGDGGKFVECYCAG